MTQAVKTLSDSSLYEATQRIAGDADALLKAAFMGHAVVQLETQEFSHESITQRPLSPHHVEDLKRSFVLKGRRHYDHPIVILATPESIKIHGASSLSPTLEASSCPLVSFVNEDGSERPGDCAGGQHRAVAGKATVKKAREDLNKRKKALEKPSEDEIAQAEKEIEELGLWAVSIYDKSKHVSAELVSCEAGDSR